MKIRSFSQNQIRLGLIILIILAGLCASGCFNSGTSRDGRSNIKAVEIRNQSISGEIREDQVWSGKINVTGDVDVNPDVTLTILPGTIIEVAVTDDQNKGSDKQ